MRYEFGDVRQNDARPISVVTLLQVKNHLGAPQALPHHCLWCALFLTESSGRANREQWRNSQRLQAVLGGTFANCTIALFQFHKRNVGAVGKVNGLFDLRDWS